VDSLLNQSKFYSAPPVGLFSASANTTRFFALTDTTVSQRRMTELKQVFYVDVLKL
jgi:hypothetical protein